MKINKKKVSVDLIKALAYKLRVDSILMTTKAKSGHPTTAVSAADIVATLFSSVINFDFAEPQNKNNDRFILSKGHGTPVFYALCRQLGLINDKEFNRFREIDGILEGHPTPRFIYSEAATGSLGQGLAVAAGMAINSKMNNLNSKTYVLMGDGELAEGSVWEAAGFASLKTLNNLIGIIDCNRFGQTGPTPYDRNVSCYLERFKAFGWNTFEVDGHNIQLLLDAFAAPNKITDKPTVIVAKTIKGYGIEMFEDKNGCHGKPVPQDQLDKVLEKLEQRFGDISQSADKLINSIKFKETFNLEKSKKQAAAPLKTTLNKELFEIDKKVSTRKAFGQALASLGATCPDIVVLDADVKNSTYTEIFEKDFPSRFIQCFIAEQTMIGVATGLEARGSIPFAATFAAFMSRAHDQIRMASIGRNALRLAGSHAGVSIGQDGPSQMGLEDISIMRSIPNSVVLYPSDAVSTFRLVEKMYEYNEGISYLRTTRSDTPIIYGETDNFEIGGCKVLHQSSNDIACVAAAGITLHEALKAHKILSDQGLSISVIDIYSVKPIDIKTIYKTAQKSNGRLIVVEDHYPEGGICEAITSELSKEELILNIKSLAVKKLTRSGSPQDLLRFCEIDAKSIAKTIISKKQPI